MFCVVSVVMGTFEAKDQLTAYKMVSLPLLLPPNLPHLHVPLASTAMPPRRNVLDGVPLGEPEGNKPVLHADLSGRTVVVTGATGGLGFEAAKHFARMGPKRLIVTGRSDEKCRVVEEGALVLTLEPF